MMRTRVKVLFWVAIGVVTHVLLFSSGYYLASIRAQTEIGARNLGDFIDELSALAYLEKNDVERARYILRVSLDGHALAMRRFGTMEFDATRPGAKKKLVLEYDKIRRKYPPIDYGDGGSMNNEVDRLVEAIKNDKKDE